MIVCSAIPMKIGEICTRYFEGPQTNGEHIIVRVCAIRVATREEYVEYFEDLMKQYPHIKFKKNLDLERGWTNYYEISHD